MGKKKNNGFGYWMTFLFFSLIFYITFSFITLKPNAYHWSLLSRIMFVLLEYGNALLCVHCYVEEKKGKEVVDG